MVEYPIVILRSKFLRLAYLLVYHAEEMNSVYSRSSFNHLGDMVGHLGQKSKSKIKGSPYIGKDDDFNRAAVTTFNQFAMLTTAKGATVVMVYPACRMTNCTATQSRFDELDRTLREYLDFPILSSPEDSFLADDLFFDTQYHLTAEGHQLRTQQLAELLLALP